MDKEHLPSKIVREIIAMLASGAYASGDRLPAERLLCQQFSVSRGTLRKALANLDSLGVVEIRPNSGIYVKSIAQAKIPQTLLPPNFEQVNLADIIEARKAIELAAVDSACLRITREQCRGLEDMVVQMKLAVTNLPDFLKLDMEFHQGIVRASGNVVLVTAFEAIYEYHKFSSVYTSQQEGEEHEALEYHERILHSLKNHDVRGCRQMLSEHLEAIKIYDRKARSTQAQDSML